MGRALIARAEQRARAADVGETRLMTNALYEANIRLYRALGYEITRREPLLGGEAVFMTKTLG